jgi:sulfotransferase
MNIHFICGLPRSGTTLLAPILRQNPRFSAGMQSPLYASFVGLIKSMSRGTDSAIFINDDQRKRVLKAVVDAFYGDHGDGTVVFDNCRGWTVVINCVAELFPNARLLCCLRNPSWILDSIERQVSKNCFQTSKIFDFAAGTDVYTRVEQLMTSQLLGPSLKGVRQAWFSNDAARLIGIRYESLVERPAETIREIYSLLGETWFEHDFNNVAYDEPEYDAGIGMPGLHSVRRHVELQKRETILPGDIFAQYDECFGEIPDHNPRGVVIL